MRKNSLLILAMIILAACSTEPSDKNISVGDAHTKYSSNLDGKTFLIFPEVRERPLKWFDSIPEGRLHSALENKPFSLNARPGEFYVFQVGAWANDSEIKDLKITFSDFTGSGGKKITADKVTCFNSGGTNIYGRQFGKTISISEGRVQVLWFGIDLDEVPEGKYKGNVTVKSENEEHSLEFILKVTGEKLVNHGYDNGAGLSRLNWLNSTAGIDNEVVKGYQPVKVEGRRIKILGRSLTIAGNGLPSEYTTFFTSSNQSVSDKGEEVVSSPFRFIIEKESGEKIKLSPGELEFFSSSTAATNWKVVNTSADADIELTGHLEFDGFIDYSLKLTAKKQLKIKDIRLEVPVNKAYADYMMGLGHEGGYRKGSWNWKWDVTRNQDMLWIGSVTGGIRIRLKAENYIRPLINVYYKYGRLNLPTSWGNNNKGGVDVMEKGNEVTFKAYSGDREMREGDILNYNFELLLTPFRTIDRKNKFGERYYHGGGTNTSVKVAAAKAAGANVINIHHAEDLYPFINYPYLDPNVAELKELVKAAHDSNIRMKFYYTTRELTKNLPEFWAFYSLNGEIIYPGPGNESKTVINSEGPNEWLVKNLREKYIPAWFNVIKEGKFKDETDLSVITTPDGRLNNFYVAGLEWMVKNIGIDGVYIDDSALDRYTLQRARKVIDQNRPEGRMDLHSWNHFNEWAGFTNCLNLYMDLLPYFDLVWIGEGRDYNRAPDHWLIEVSGIPFGLPGQMLEGGGNPWRGMVYGITNRAGWVGNTPVEIWKFWDEFKIADKLQKGYWEKDCPVRTNNSNVFASVYQGDGESVISVANWTDKPQKVSLDVDFNALGINPSSAEILIPGIKDFQDARNIINLKALSLEGKKGLLVIIKNKK